MSNVGCSTACPFRALPTNAPERRPLLAPSAVPPLCANCKNVRDDAGLWEQAEAYITRHSELRFSHGLGPEYSRKLYPTFRTRPDVLVLRLGHRRAP